MMQMQLYLYPLFFTTYIALQSHWQEWLLLFNLDQSLGPNWDLYLIATLAGVLGMVVYFRRPQPQ
jgi:hypothetical protein